MEYIVLPIEKVVKFDAKGFSYPTCPVCGSDELSAQITEDTLLTLYCDEDNFALRQKETNVYEADFSLYSYDIDWMVTEQEVRLKKLFKDGFISYVDLLGYLKIGRSKFDEPVKNVPKCEMVKCENPRTTTTTIYNGFEPKSTWVCEDCNDKYGVDL